MDNQTPQSTFDERLDKIFDNFDEIEAPNYVDDQLKVYMTKTEAKAAITSLVLEVIGEDTNSGAFEQSSGTSGLSVMDSYQNSLRAQQRSIITKEQQ